MSPASGAPHPIGRWIASGTLDTELGGLLWLLVEARVPVVVAGAPGADRRGLRDLLRWFLPSGATLVVLDGEQEDFAWMPEVVELGWRREGGTGGGAPRAIAATTVLVADLDDGPGGTWSERARIAIRALAVGYGILAIATGERLEDVLANLKAPPVSAADDELARLGVVLILGDDHVTAAHYLRPVSRDGHGHVQRMGPAVLATWDAANDRFEHFAWGITAELANRIGVQPIEVEREQARRAEQLATMAAADPGD